MLHEYQSTLQACTNEATLLSMKCMTAIDLQVSDASVFKNVVRWNCRTTLKNGNLWNSKNFYRNMQNSNHRNMKIYRNRVSWGNSGQFNKNPAMFYVIQRKTLTLACLYLKNFLQLRIG